MRQDLPLSRIVSPFDGADVWRTPCEAIIDAGDSDTSVDEGTARLRSEVSTQWIDELRRR